MSKIKLLRILVPVIIILSGTFAFQSTAQGSSPGCGVWNGIGSFPVPVGTGLGVTSRQLFAGEVLSATFTLPAPGTAQVQIDGTQGVGVSSATLASGSITLSVTIPADGTYTEVVARYVSGTAANINVTYSCSQGAGGGGTNASAIEVGFNDGRINYLDAAAPIAVYPYSDDSGSGFDIYSVEGDLILRVTGENLLNLPLIDDVNNITVRQVFGGVYQVTAPQYNGKTYVLEFVAPVRGIGYDSWEQD